MAETPATGCVGNHEWDEQDAIWAIRYAGGFDRVRRGRRFSNLPVGTILRNEVLGWTALKCGYKSWRIKHGGTPLDQADLLMYFMDGLLVVVNDGAPQIGVTRHTRVPVFDLRDAV